MALYNDPGVKPYSSRIAPDGLVLRHLVARDVHLADAELPAFADGERHIDEMLIRLVRERRALPHVGVHVALLPVEVRHLSGVAIDLGLLVDVALLDLDVRLQLLDGVARLAGEDDLDT